MQYRAIAVCTKLAKMGFDLTATYVFFCLYKYVTTNNAMKLIRIIRATRVWSTVCSVLLCAMCTVMRGAVTLRQRNDVYMCHAKW